MHPMPNAIGTHHFKILMLPVIIAEVLAILRQGWIEGGASGEDALGHTLATIQNYHSLEILNDCILQKIVRLAT